jgi:hypothetical protein
MIWANRRDFWQSDTIALHLIQLLLNWMWGIIPDLSTQEVGQEDREFEVIGAT